MVAVRKQWVLLIDLPFTVRELVAKGYRNFRLQAGEDTKRVEKLFEAALRTDP